MALTAAELAQVKFILGYGNLTALARPYFDIALVFEDVVVQALDTYWAEGYVRNTVLVNYFALDAQIASSATRLQATELVGDLKLDARRELAGLQDLKDFWADELSRCIKVPRVRGSRFEPSEGGSTIEVT
jgi:hypothetical protein